MYLSNLILLLCCLASLSLSAQTSLTIELADIEQAGEGQLIALLYASEDGFPREHDKAVHRVATTEFTNWAILTFDDLPAGDYAVLIYQDLNANGEMDTNFIGFPKEPLGAFNMESMGRPSYRRSVVTVGSAAVTVTLKLLNQ